MKKLLFILILFGIILNNYGQVINLSPDSTLYKLHLLPGTPVIPPDSAALFTMTGVQYDSVNQTVIGFDVNGIRFVTAYGTSWPMDTTNKLFAFNLADTASYKDTTTYFKVIRDSVKYFRLFTYSATGSVYNQDTAFIEGSPLDSLASFVVDEHDLDTAIVTTAIKFDPDADNYQLRYLEGLIAPSITAGTLALSNADSSLFKSLKIKIAVPGNNTNYTFRLFSTGIDTVWNTDTVQLDILPVSPSFFADGIIWVEGTDTTQFDSIYTSGTALNFESDGFLFSLDSIGTSAEAFPQVESVDSILNEASTAQQPCRMPSGIQDGDLLLAFFSGDAGNGSESISINEGVSGANWTIEDSLTYGANGTVGAVIWKIADDAGSDTLQVTASSVEFSSFICYRISGAASVSVIESEKYRQTTTGNADPPSLTPSAGHKWLVFVAASLDATASATAAPTDFGNMDTETGTGGSSASISVARRELETGVAYNPGTFTNPLSRGSTFTVFVKPE